MNKTKVVATAVIAVVSVSSFINFYLANKMFEDAKALVEQNRKELVRAEKWCNKLDLEFPHSFMAAGNKKGLTMVWHCSDPTEEAIVLDQIYKEYRDGP